jgi:hypothetical protein
MKVISLDIAGSYTVELSKAEMECLIETFIDVDRTRPALEGEDLGSLEVAVQHTLSELMRVRN